MNIYSILRRVIAGILGIVWGYRLDLAIERGISWGEYLVFFILVGIIFGTLRLLVTKEKNTSDKKLIRREVYKDAFWAILFMILGFVAKQALDLVFT